MYIEDIEIGHKVTVQVIINNEQLEFPLTVLEPAPKKHGIYTSAVMKNDKVLSFKAAGILTHLIFATEDQKPHIFYNVVIQTLKSEDGSYCYCITSPAPSKEFNRRGAFRCFLGIYTVVQIGVNHTAIDTTLKDVSATGFSFILPSGAKEFDTGSIAHIVLSDYIKESSENFSFHLTGIIVRRYQMENGSTVYGCKLNGKVVGLDKYISKKERLQLHRNRQSH